jgi:hypothetical protein
MGKSRVFLSFKFVLFACLAARGRHRYPFFRMCVRSSPACHLPHFAMGRILVSFHVRQPGVGSIHTYTVASCSHWPVSIVIAEGHGHGAAEFAQPIRVFGSSSPVQVQAQLPACVVTVGLLSKRMPQA